MTRLAASPKTRSIVLALVALLMYLAGLFTMQDFAQWVVPQADPCGSGCGPMLWPEPLTLFSRAIRMVRTLLCFGLVWLIGPTLWLTQKDRRRLLIAFALAVAGDGFLIFKGHGIAGGELFPEKISFLAGVAMFLICHGWLIARHLVSVADFKSDLKRPGVAPKVWGLLALSLAPSVALLAWAWSDLKPALDITYMLVLSLSLWMGLSVLPRRDDFPRTNRWLIAVGITLFYICDVSLGLGVRLAGSRPEIAGIFGQLPNLTYSWALICLAMSGYHWRSLVQDRGRASTPIAALESDLAEFLGLEGLERLDAQTYARLEGRPGHFVSQARDAETYASTLVARLEDGERVDADFFADFDHAVDTDAERDEVARLRRMWLD